MDGMWSVIVDKWVVSLVFYFFYFLHSVGHWVSKFCLPVKILWRERTQWQWEALTFTVFFTHIRSWRTGQTKSFAKRSLQAHACFKQWCGACVPVLGRWERLRTRFICSCRQEGKLSEALWLHILREHTWRQPQLTSLASIFFLNAVATALMSLKLIVSRELYCSEFWTFHEEYKESS